MIVQNNNIPQIQSLFPVKANAGGGIDANGVTPTDSKGKKQAVRNGRATLAKAKQSTPQIKQSKANIQGLQPTVTQANTANFRFLTNLQLVQMDAIQGFQASLGGATAPKTEFKLDSSVPAFNLEAAQETLKAGAFDFTNTLQATSNDAKAKAENANNDGNNAFSVLGEALGSFDGGLGSIGTGGVQIATGIGMLSTSGFTFGLSAIPAIAMIAKGGVDVAQGFGEVTQGQGKSQEAETTGEGATQTYERAAQTLGETGANLGQLESFYTSLNTQAFPVLNQAQASNDQLLSLGSQLGATVEVLPASPATPAGTGAGNANPIAQATPATNTGFVAPSATPAFNLSDASWATPVTPSTGASTPTIQALGVPPLAGGNSQEANAQAGGLTAEEKQFMTAFEGNAGVVNSANAQAQGALGSAPTGFDTASLASQTTVADASQSQGLQELYTRLQAKEQQAQAQKQNNGLQVPQLGQNAQNAVAPQGQVDPNAVAQAPQDQNAQNPLAPQGQVDPNAVAQAPQDPAQRSLIIPSFAPKATALQPALV
jgi:hypothetical protein